MTELRERIREREEERDVLFGEVEYDKEQLRDHLIRLRNESTKLLDANRTLREKLIKIFKEQGITIASIITAIGSIIAAIVTSVTGASTMVIPNPPSPNGGGVKEWVKKHLQNFASILAKLGEKALIALPGVIGAIVSFLLKSVGSIVGWVAGNVWILIVGLGIVLYDYLIVEIKGKRSKKK